MEIKITQVTSWKRVLKAARFTVGKADIDKEPSQEFKRSMLKSEHSPIRLLEFDIELRGIPNFVANHLVRHHEGVEKFVATLRDDRTGRKPEDVNRLTPTDMMISANVQGLINISRKRLCRKAHPETVKVWQAVKDELFMIEPIVSLICVPECVYRGFCPENESCGFCKTDAFRKMRTDYKKFND